MLYDGLAVRLEFLQLDSWIKSIYVSGEWTRKRKMHTLNKKTNYFIKLNYINFVSKINTLLFNKSNFDRNIQINDALGAQTQYKFYPNLQNFSHVQFSDQLKHLIEILARLNSLRTYYIRIDKVL